MRKVKVRPVAVVELDNASHRPEWEQDAEKDRTLEVARWPMVRVQARRGYAVDGLRAMLAGGLASSPS